MAGISVSNISEQTKKGLNIYGGVRVDKLSDSQINNSKLEINDIITKINNDSVLDVNDFNKKLQSIKNNTMASLLVYRNSNPIYMAIKISK